MTIIKRYLSQDSPLEVQKVRGRSHRLGDFWGQYVEDQRYGLILDIEGENVSQLSLKQRNLLTSKGLEAQVAQDKKSIQIGETNIQIDLPEGMPIDEIRETRFRPHDLETIHFYKKLLRLIKSGNAHMFDVKHEMWTWLTISSKPPENMGMYSEKEDLPVILL